LPDNDKMMRAHASNTPVPEFPNPAFTTPPALSQARVAIVTSAALHFAADDGFSPISDPKFTVLEDSERELRLGHFSPNFDRGGFAADINVVYPVDRLRELAEQGTIASVASRHYAFAGNQDDTVSGIRLDTGPEVAKRLLEDGVNVVLLTPV
jgi:D-proline reductase (dithiol) PrdB